MKQLQIFRLPLWLPGCWLLSAILLLLSFSVLPLFPAKAFLQSICILCLTGLPVVALCILFIRSLTKQKTLEEKLRRLQMNPHFLFNMLNSVADLSRRESADTVDRFLVKYAKLMRMVLDHSNHELISLSQELEMIRIYLELECTRKNRSFTYDISLDSSIDTDSIFVPPMLLQPFVENSIWHGLDNIENGSIKIQIIYGADHLEYLVSDNGRGLNPSVSYPGKLKAGRGISIALDRVRYRWRSWWPPAGIFQLRHPKKGLEVAIRVPLIQ